MDDALSIDQAKARIRVLERQLAEARQHPPFPPHASLTFLENLDRINRAM